MRARIRSLGFGQRADRADLERLCGSHSAANHFIDKTTSVGLLVPIEWGSYQVPSEATIDWLGRMANPVQRRFLSWVRTLPALSKRSVAFFAPRVWRFSDLSLDEPAPVLRLAPSESTAARPTAQWGAFLYDLGEPETWAVRLGDETVAKVPVPGWFDSLVLARSNADPRWRAATSRWTEHLTAPQVQRLEKSLATLHRIGNPKPILPIMLGHGPPHRQRLVTPAWFENLHRDALEAIARGLHAG
ncbi:MAG: hypothetical protein HYT80_00325 [Euryarchaeota archaeon]|nr:hypothetical protein [Euryarchaeota archaeon]